MINLKLHQCYMPFIFIYPNSHTDKNNKDYYRAWFKTDKLEKKGFIVREDFYNKWNEKEIAEININLTEKGASIVSYYSFEDFEVKDSRKFVQTTGIYLDGTYIVNNPETGKKETTTFIPSFPNRFSFNSKGYRKFLSVNLKTYTRRQIMRHTGISNRDLTKEELKNVQDSVRYFYVISKYDYHYRYDGNEHGSWVIDTFSEWFSLVFYSKDALVESIESTNLATTDQIEEILKGLGDQEMILEKQVEYIKAIKKIAQTQFTDYLKVEVYSDSMFIEDVRMKIMLSHLEGVKFDSKLLYMGTELEFLYGEKKTTDLGIKLNEDYEEKFEEIDSKIGDIFLYVILQV